jgi:hypothetical protein
MDETSPSFVDPPFVSEFTTESPTLPVHSYTNSEYTRYDCMGLSPHAIENIITQIKRPDVGFELKDRKYHMRTYTRCFIGNEAVTWFQKNFKFDRLYAIDLMQFLMRGMY